MRGLSSRASPLEGQAVARRREVKQSTLARRVASRSCESLNGRCDRPPSLNFLYLRFLFNYLIFFILATMATDPYHAVQQEIQSSLQAAATLRSSYLRIRSTAREDSEELAWARNEVR